MPSNSDSLTANGFISENGHYEIVAKAKEEARLKFLIR
jgi:hypothetical protein